MPAPALATASLKEALVQLDAAQKADEALPEGFDAKAVTGALLDAAAKGEIDASNPGKLLGTGLAVVGGLACASTGALVPLAPICAAAGGLVGELVGGLFKDPPKAPQGPTAGQKLDAAKVADYQWIQSRRKTLLASSLVKIGADPKARKQLEAAINELLPLFPLDALNNPKQRPAFEDGSWFGGFALILWHWSVIFGSQAPLLVAGQVDAATVDGAIDYVARVGEIVKEHGQDFSGQTKALIDLIKANKGLFQGGQQAGKSGAPGGYEAMLFLYENTRTFLFPVLEEALAQQLKAIFAGAAIQARIKLVSALDRLAGQLEALGMSSADAREIAQTSAAMLATSSPEKVLQEIQAGADLHDKPSPQPAKGGIGWLGWSLGLLTLGSAAVAGVRVVQGKPPVPPQVKQAASTVADKARRGVQRIRRAW